MIFFKGNEAYSGLNHLMYSNGNTFQGIMMNHIKDDYSKMVSNGGKISNEGKMCDINSDCCQRSHGIYQNEATMSVSSTGSFNSYTTNSPPSLKSPMNHLFKKEVFDDEDKSSSSSILDTNVKSKRKLQRIRIQTKS